MKNIKSDHYAVSSFGYLPPPLSYICSGSPFGREVKSIPIAAE